MIQRFSDIRYPIKSWMKYSKKKSIKCKFCFHRRIPRNPGNCSQFVLFKKIVGNLELLSFLFWITFDYFYKSLTAVRWKFQHLWVESQESFQNSKSANLISRQDNDDNFSKSFTMWKTPEPQYSTHSLTMKQNQRG